MNAKNHYLESVTLRRDAVADGSAFPFCVPALRNFEGVKLHPKVTFFVGENGTGKSTLLEAIAEKLGFRWAFRPMPPRATQAQPGSCFTRRAGAEPGSGGVGREGQGLSGPAPSPPPCPRTAALPALLMPGLKTLPKPVG